MRTSEIRKLKCIDVDKHAGRLIRCHRLALNIPPAQFAKKLKMSELAYLRAEAGDIRFVASDIFTLKREFNLPLEGFFSHEGECFSDIIIANTEMADVFLYFSNIEDPQVRSHILKQMKMASTVF